MHRFRRFTTRMSDRLFCRVLARRSAIACAALAATGAALAAGGTPPDRQPRVAVISAFDAELAVLRGATRHARTQRIHGIDFTTGELEGRPVVLLLSGISMTNAALSTQMALDHYHVTHIVFSGIAGGVNPALHIGDVTVPQRWGAYLEAVMARETAPGVFTPPPWMTDATWPHFGMIHPRPVGVRSDHSDKPEPRFWFDADPAMLAAARQLSSASLARCAQSAPIERMHAGAPSANSASDATAPPACLKLPPQLVFGGNGVSGAAFVDNAAFREYAFKTFEANVLDMETAAVAHVAYTNGVPYLAFRSLSDLAGGGEGENEIGTFFQIAANNSAAVVRAFLRRWRPSAYAAPRSATASAPAP